MANILKDLFEHPKLASAAAFAGVVVSALGFLGTDYFKFKAEVREELRLEYLQSRSAATAVVEALRAFARQANGEIRVDSIDAAEKAELEKKINSLYREAKTVADKVPQASQEFSRYEQAMIKLQEAAVSMAGPADARKFVEAFSAFLDSRQRFENKVQAVRGSYL